MEQSALQFPSELLHQLLELISRVVWRLSDIVLLQVHYSDRQNGQECVTYLTLSPVQMTFQGIGSSPEISHDQV